MARRRSRKARAVKLQPAVKTLLFQLDGAEGSPYEYYIDLSQCASLVNRRFYRQGLNWAVSSIKMFTSANAVASVMIEKLPETWVMSNSWEKGFRAWQRMNNEALEESESVKPRFLDFKIYADAEHHRRGFAGNLLPLSNPQVPAGPPTLAVATAGEWESSKFIIPKTDGTDDVFHREVLAVGSNYPGAGASTLDAVSLIEGYAASRGLPDIKDPNAPDDAGSVAGNTPQNWLQATFNEGTDQADAVLEDMIGENNQAPYPFENDGVHVDTMYPGGANQLNGLQIHDFEGISGTTIGNATHFDGGMFPCGLIKISMEASQGNPVSAAFQINLVPGTHRGYLAEPMTEM
jgi:hypothetical protein